MNFSALKALLTIVPTWCWVILGIAGFGLACELQGRAAIERDWKAEREKQAELARETRKAGQLVRAETEIVYRDRIKTVYVKGDEIEKQVPVFVTPDDDGRFVVNVGFVRNFNAAWAGADSGFGAVADREPAGIPLSEVAATNDFNITACRVWREIAIGTREQYLKVQAAFNAGQPAAGAAD